MPCAVSLVVNHELITAEKIGICCPALHFTIINRTSLRNLYPMSPGVLQMFTCTNSDMMVPPLHFQSITLRFISFKILHIKGIASNANADNSYKLPPFSIHILHGIMHKGRSAATRVYPFSDSRVVRKHACRSQRN